ncbi:probable disease resistance protein RPP1 isoform X1 [Raphanus sativus]|uniref:ADP-ribosyl cyclase/cyclic ADP-ribose hydrolase n=1 Tax=Raphanus sativus TaxID=3726 RepID=A0A6J0KPN9_RAPSA|nr:probable disease resistance protein RPP1 isoform X1 [Raphanus sativus]XP_056848761.1 probable disease resistance protein RPP1 isoform X1 [Raphanus sativus]
MDSYFSLTNPNLVAVAICFLGLLGTIFFNRKSRSHRENKTIVSSSTLLTPPPSLPHNWKHHVFPSFHGADVRTNFLSHVLKELRSKGIDSFIDNDIERSKLIGPELVEAIRGSRIAIVLLSQNYASSTWCLNELVEIMKCREEFGQTVMPLFYQVDPTDIKKQTGDFGKVLGKTCKGKTKEEIQRWKHALTELAQIAGFHSTNGENEAKMIEDIATDVSNKLNLSAPSNDFDGLVGMESRMAEMRRLLQLDSDEVRKIGILGPPGIGKTTIARSLFNQHSQDFQLCVFMDNIKRKYVIMACSDDYSVKLDLQKQFMSQLTNETGIQIPHLGVAKDRLKDKKVLVVLDDVDQLVQLEAMAKETSWFGPGSRIIITTQDENILKASGIDHIHRVNLPSDDEALQMFCMYAFGQKYPKDGFEELASEVRSLVGGLPLGLRVMGSYFRGMSEEDWREAVPRLKIHLNRNGEIASILKFSYDALNDEDKRLFLHIACFFSGEPADMVERCLEKCFEDVRLGLRVLSEKSLIYRKSGLIRMSTLLFQLGRQIVRKESVSEPGKRQFLNDAIDIGEVLSDDKAGSSSVIGIELGLNEEITWISERAFERLSNLQFIKILSRGVNPLSMNYISRKLKVLIWPMFPMSCFPSSFNPEFLVNLYARNSNLEKLWEENKPLSNLEWMDLALSRSFKELPDLSTATNLYYLDLSYCSSLLKLPSSIGNATNLEKLSLSYCSSLVELPSSIGNAFQLKTLNLKGCSSLVKLPSSIWNIVNLEELNLENCSSLVEFPSLLKSETEQFQKNNIIKYSESSTNIEELHHPWIGRILRLRRLVLSGMRKLVSLPQLPDSLLELDAENCESLERLHCCFPNQDIRLNFANCFKLNQEARNLIIQTPTNKYAVFPAEEVPICFSYRSFGGSLTVKLNQLPVGKSTKFKACILCAYDDENMFELWESASVYCTITSGGNASIAFKKRVERVLPGNLCTFEVEVDTEEVTSTELLFDFGLLNLDFKTWKIKECGILQLL